jgi:hypothetical protein
MAEDAVALLLKHKKGYCAPEDEEMHESQDIPGGNQSSKDDKKPKRVLGPEKPSFLNSNPDYESWVLCNLFVFRLMVILSHVLCRTNR